MLTNNKDIAILMAAFNAERYIREQIESIIAQSNTDWCLYIRNDGSTDSTQRIIDEYVDNVRIFQIDKGGENLGCSKNFFRLLEVVESKYYAFSDADDVWLPENLEYKIEAIKEIENINSDKPALVFCDSVVCDKSLNVIEKSYWRSIGLDPKHVLNFDAICVCCPIGGANSLFNQSLKGNIFPVKSDRFMYDFWIAICAINHGIVAPIYKPLIFYRQHGNNFFGVDMDKSNSLFKMIKKIFATYFIYKKESEDLDSINYGGLVKYSYNKFRIKSKMILGKK